jgi:hypothetical protein
MQRYSPSNYSVSDFFLYIRMVSTINYKRVLVACHLPFQMAGYPDLIYDN